MQLPLVAVLLVSYFGLINGAESIISVDVLPELDTLKIQQVLESKAMADCMRGSLRERRQPADSSEAGPQLSEHLNLRERMTRCMKEISGGALVPPVAQVVGFNEGVRARNVEESEESAEADDREDSAEAEDDEDSFESNEAAAKNDQEEVDSEEGRRFSEAIPLPGKRVIVKKAQKPHEPEPQYQVHVNDDAVVIMADESVAQPAEPMPQPVAEPIAQPAAEPMAEPMPEPVAEPIAQPAKPMSEPDAEPAAEPMPEPVAEPIAQPAAESVKEQELKPETVEIAIKPEAEPIAKPVAMDVALPAPVSFKSEMIDDKQSVVVESVNSANKDSKLSVKAVEKQSTTSLCPTINYCTIGKLYTAVQGAIAKQCKGCAAYVQCLGSQQATSMCRNDPVDGAFDDDLSAESTEDLDSSVEKAKKAEGKKAEAKQGLPVDAISEAVKAITRSSDWESYLNNVIGIKVNHEANRNGRLGRNCYALYGMFRGCLMPSLCMGYSNV